MGRKQKKTHREHPAVPNRSLTADFLKTKIYVSILMVLALAAACLGALAFAKHTLLPSIINKVSGAVGTVQGAAQGWSEGGKAGKEEGLSAKDTTVLLENKMESTGKLQVLLVDMKLSDIYTQGEEGEELYAALYTVDGEGVFTVDLRKAEAVYDEENDRTVIEIPKPEFEPYVDNSTLNVLAEYNKPTLFNGDAKDGYRGYLNTTDQLNEKIRTEFSENPELTEQAEDSAIRQVEQLAKSVCQSRYVEVRFQVEG